MDARRQRQHGLMNANRLRISRVDAARYVDLVVLTEHGKAKHSGNRRDAIVCESDHQAVAPSRLKVQINDGRMR